jgi:hypothetical protein
MKFNQSQIWDDMCTLDQLIAFSPKCLYDATYKPGWGDEEGLACGSIWVKHPEVEDCVQLVMTNDGGWGSVASATYPLEIGLEQDTVKMMEFIQSTALETFF